MVISIQYPSKSGFHALVLFLTAFMIVLPYRCVTGETIYLIDGRVVNETIVERGPYYIITETEDKFPKKYFEGQIERIEEDETPVGNGDTDVSGIISVDKYALIKEFIAVSGVRKNLEQNIGLAIEQAQEENREELREIFVIDEIIDELAPLYDKHYTREDLSAMIEFYRSSSGQKMIEATPKIMQETIKVSIDYIKEKAAP